MTSPAGTAIEYPEKIDPAVLKVAGVVVLGAIMSILDITVVNVALRDLPDRLRQGRRAAGLLHRRVDRHRLHARPGHRHPDVRLGRRPVRHQAALHGGDHPVHARFRPVRDRDLDRDADRVPRAPGAGRRHAHAGRDDDHDPSGGPGADGSPDGDPRGADPARPDLRAHLGRLADRQPQLALDLPDQRADRAAGAGLLLVRARAGQPGPVRDVRLRRHADDEPRPRAVPLRHLVDPGRGRHRPPQGPGPRPDRSVADGGVRVLQLQAQAPAAGPAAVQEPEPLRVAHHHVHLRRGLLRRPPAGPAVPPAGAGRVPAQRGVAGRTPGPRRHGHHAHRRCR